MRCTMCDQSNAKAFIEGKRVCERCFHATAKERKTNRELKKRKKRNAI